VSNLLEKSFGIHAVPFVLDQVSPQFYASLGAALRSREKAESGEFDIINLGGEDLEKAIYEEQILNFISLWRNITVSIFIVLLVSLIFADSFLVGQSRNLTGQLAAFSVSGTQKEIAGLSAKASEFNGLVSTIKSVRSTVSPWYDYLSLLNNLADSNKIKIRSLSISSIGAPITLFGSATDYNAALNFKNVLSSNGSFSNVSLPITQITIASDNTASFSVTFQFNVNR
jgi:Tfp pilus assembly protein PilN